MNRKGYKHTSLGWIPDDWEVKKIRDIAKISSGTTPLRSVLDYFLHGEIHWVKTTDLNNSIILETEEKVTERALAETSLRIYPKGTLLVAMYGGFNQIGRTGLLGIEAAINQALSAITVDPQKTDRVFLLNWLNAKVGLWKSFAGSSRKDPNITSSDVADFPIIEMALAEQQRISVILSTLDTAIAKEQQLIDALQIRHRALMQQLFSKRKRLKGFKGQWTETKLGSLGESYNGLTGKSKEHFGYGKPFVTYLNVFTNSKMDPNQIGYVEINEDESQNTIQYGDFLFTVSSETPEEVGMTSVVLDKVSNVYLNSFCFGFRLKDFQTLLPEFGRYYFRNNETRKGIVLLAQGSTRFNISKDGIRNLILKLPPVPEQTAIASVLNASEKEIQLHRRRLATLQQQKKGLMQVLLTGKVRVNPKEE